MRRARALMALDAMLTKKENAKALSNALEAEFNRNPVRFFRTIVMPLLPREARLTLEPAGVVQWRSLVDRSRRPDEPGGTLQPKSLPEASNDVIDL